MYMYVNYSLFLNNILWSAQVLEWGAQNSMC